MPITRYHLAALAAALVSAVALSACASSTAGTGSGSAAPQSATAPSPSAPTSTRASVAPAPTPPPPSSSTPTGRKPHSTAPSAVAGGSLGNGNPDTWCGSSQLAVVGSAPPGGDAAGHTAVLLKFVNVSHYRCVLYGYPGVDGTARGHSIAHATRTYDGYFGGCRCSSLHGVTVAPGGTASAIVEGDIGDGSAACDRFRGLLVTPPNTYHSTPVRVAPHSCDFTVHPVVPGSSGSA